MNKAQEWWNNIPRWKPNPKHDPIDCGASARCEDSREWQGNEQDTEARCEDGGQPLFILADCSSRRPITLHPEDALSMAKWIIETFGEAK